MKRAHGITGAPSVNAPARASAVFTLAGIISKGAAVVFTPFFTRLLSSSEYGTYSLFHSYLSVLVVIGTLELSGGAVLRAFQKHRHYECAVILTAALIFIPVAALSVGGFYLIRRIFGGGALFGGAYIMLFSSVVSTGIINLFVARAKFLYKPKLALLLAVLQSIVAPILSISLIYLEALKKFPHVAVKIGTASTVFAVIALCFIFILIRKSRREIANRDGGALSFFKECAPLLLRLALPMLPYYFCIMAISQADKLSVSRSLGAATLGGYSVAYAAGLSPSCISQGLLCALSPWVMRKARARDFAKIRGALSTVTVMLCALTVAFLSIAPELFSVLAPSEYRSSISVLFVIALAPIPLLSVNLASGILCAYEKTLPTVLSGVLCAIPSVAACYALTSRLGATFAAMTVLFAYLLLAAVQIFNIRRLTGELMLDTVRVLRALMLTALLAAAMYAFSDSLAARLALASLAAASLLYTLVGAKALLAERD